ncbi:MAG: biotin--[acetyl-CoA-carboxylase] ligase [Methanoculleaceae archaeon]
MGSTREEVLQVLEKAGGWISGAAIAGELGITRSAVWKHIQELREEGYEIDSSRKQGYCLRKATTLLLPHEIKKYLKTQFIGHRIIHHNKLVSTVFTAKKLCEVEDPASLHGTIIIAEEQTGGMGRLGRVWFSPAGGIWTTIILAPKIPIDHLHLVTMAGSAAVARAIRKKLDLGALIKWPNDIYIGDRKVCGLLLELSAEADRIHYCLLSIGIDANIPAEDLPQDMDTQITSLSSELGHDVDRAKLLAMILGEFEQRYHLVEEGEYDSITREWKSLSLTLNQRVRIRTLKKTFEGRAIDIDEHGALIIRKDNGKIERVIAGDCYKV